MAIDSRWGGMGMGTVVPLNLPGKTNKNQEKSTQNWNKAKHKKFEFILIY